MDFGGFGFRVYELRIWDLGPQCWMGLGFP